LAKNHKNLKYILTTIRDNPGITAANFAAVVNSLRNISGPNAAETIAKALKAAGLSLVSK